MVKTKVVLKFIFLLSIGLTALAVVAGLWLRSLLTPVSLQPVEPTRFVVAKGQGVNTIADRLTEAGYIKHPLVFRYLVKMENLGNKIQAGSFELSPSMTPIEIGRALTQGTNDLWVTIPEGWRREEIAESFQRQGLDQFKIEEFLSLSAGDEGKLFPDTYLVSRQATASQLYTLLTNTFERKVLDELATEIARSNRDFNDVLVMASIVEREASGAEEMRHVAGILWNRIELGMPLQADATLQYVKGYDKTEQKWWPQPLSRDKELKSPFNTYQNPGLPPRPISNPGLNAIKASLNPIETNNLFYLHDRQGRIHYAQTLSEHNANVERYLR